MAGSPYDLDLLLAVAREEIEHLRADPRLGEVQGTRGEALREHVLDLYAAVETRLENRPASTASAQVRDAYARSLREAIIAVQSSHAALPWLAASRSPRLNLGSLYLTEECARTLVGSEVDLVVVPNDRFMYSVVSWPFLPVVQGAPGYVAATARRPIVLNYPLSDSNRLLLHPVFAHELGHPSVQEHRLVEAAEQELAADAEFVIAFHQTIATLQDQFPHAPESELSGLVRRRLRFWLEELLCDHLALDFLGPAFLWAFSQFVMPLSYNRPADKHPPNTLRIQLGLLHLTDRGWRPYMETVAPQVTGWLDEIAADTNTQAFGPAEIFICSQLSRRSDVLRSLAAERVGTEQLDVDEAEREAAQAVELLQELILPIGLDDTLTSRAILMGGWQFAFQKHGDSSGGMVRALRDVALQELVGKAMEMSTVSTAWKQSV